MECFTMLAHDHMFGIENIRAMKKGKVNAKIWNVMTDALPWADTLAEFQAAYFEYKGWAARAFSAVEQNLDLIERHGDEMYLIKSAADVFNPENAEKSGVLIGFEGGKCLEGDLDLLRALYRMGVRHLQFSWCMENQLGHPQTDFAQGLTQFGVEAVGEMNRLGMIIDVTHSSVKGICQMIKHSQKPVISGHVGVKALSSDVQNLDDELIRLLADKGCVAGLHFCTHIIKDHVAVATIDDLIDEMEYIKKVATVDMIALGPDFFSYDERFKRNTMFFYEDDQFEKDEEGYELSFVKGLEDVSKINNLISHLERRKFSATEIEKIMGLNLLRVLKEVL